MDVFISHRTGDASQAQNIETTLGKARLRAFFDKGEAGIPPGANLSATIMSTIRASKAMLVVIGPSFVLVDNLERLKLRDDWVRQELKEAERLGIPIIPVVFDEIDLRKLPALPDDLGYVLFGNSPINVSSAHFNEDLRKMALCVRRELLSSRTGARRRSISLFLFDFTRVAIALVLMTFGRDQERHRIPKSPPTESQSVTGGMKAEEPQARRVPNSRVTTSSNIQQSSRSRPSLEQTRQPASSRSVKLPQSGVQVDPSVDEAFNNARKKMDAEFVR